jgi:hypothetical protein
MTSPAPVPLELPVRAFTILVTSRKAGTTVHGVYHDRELARAFADGLNRQLHESGFMAVVYPVYGRVGAKRVARFLKARLLKWLGV